MVHRGLKITITHQRVKGEELSRVALDAPDECVALDTPHLHDLDTQLVRKLSQVHDLIDISHKQTNNLYYIIASDHT